MSSSSARAWSTGTGSSSPSGSPLAALPCRGVSEARPRRGGASSFLLGMSLVPGPSLAPDGLEVLLRRFSSFSRLSLDTCPDASKRQSRHAPAAR